MKNLLISRPIISLIAPHLKRFLMFFCLATKDLYNDGARGGDGSDCLTLLDLCMLLVGLVGYDCEGSPTAISQLEIEVHSFILLKLI